MQAITLPQNLTKSAVQEAADLILDQLLTDGGIPEAWAKVKWLENLSEAVLQRLERHIVENPPTDTFKTGGVKIEVQYRKTYEYAHDAAWQTAKHEEQAAAEARKKREEFLKTLPEALADPNTGEMIEPARIVETKAIVKTTFPK